MTLDHDVIICLCSQYNAAPLKSFALAMISRNVEQVMRTNGWKELILNDQVKNFNDSDRIFCFAVKTNKQNNRMVTK